MNTGLISVIVPSFKMGRFIGEALESVGVQTNPHWEVIVVDDAGPEDGTRATVEAFAAKHPEHRVEYIRHETNKGVSAARNTAIKAARGELLAFLDPDDVWMPIHLERHLWRRGQQPAPVVTASGCLLFDVQQPSADLGQWMITSWEASIFPASLASRNSMNPSAVVVDKCVVLDAGGFDESRTLQHVEDWDLWLRLIERAARFGFIPELTVRYRRHANAAANNEALMRNSRSAFTAKHRDFLAQLTARFLYEQSVRTEGLERRVINLEKNWLVRLGRVIGKVSSMFRGGR